MSKRDGNWLEDIGISGHQDAGYQDIRISETVTINLIL